MPVTDVFATGVVNPESESDFFEQLMRISASKDA
jgi:hypothetical protein